MHHSLSGGFSFLGVSKSLCEPTNATVVPVAHLTPSIAQVEGWELSGYTLWEGEE